MIGIDPRSFAEVEAALRAAPANANILDLLALAGLDKSRHLAGGDWRSVDFRGLDLTGLNFSNALLRKARFANAKVTRACFVGTDVGTTDLHRAVGWRDSNMDDDQRTFLELKALRADGPGVTADAVRIFADRLESRDWVALIKSLRRFADAWEIFEMVPESLRADPYILTTLLSKVADQETHRTSTELDTFLARFPQLAKSMDAALLATLISKARDFSQALQWFHQYREHVTLTEWVYNATISKADFVEQAQPVIEEAKERGFPVDAISLNKLIWKAKDYRSAKYVYGLIDEPRTADLNAVLHHATWRELLPKGDVWTLLKNGPPSDVATYNILIGACDSLSAGDGLYGEMITRELKPDIHTAFALLSLISPADLRGLPTAIDRLTQLLDEGVDVRHEDVLRVLLLLAGIESDNAKTAARDVAGDRERIGTLMSRLVTDRAAEKLAAFTKALAQRATLLAPSNVAAERRSD